MTDQYAVIGNPISHRKSPLIHMTFARQTGQDIDYRTIEGPLGGFRDSAQTFRAAGGCGMNITAPFKLDAFAFATDLSEQARLAGAVNALKFADNKIYAENFDGIGLVRDIVHNLGCAIEGRRILLLGAGGAARGAILPLLRQRPERLVIVNRTVSKAQALCQQFAALASSELSYFSYAALADAAAQFDLVINATSTGVHGELPPVQARVFAPNCLAYELAYGKGLTPFLRLARDAGAARLADGVGMLVEQAAEAFEWWRGVRPESASVIAMLTVPLR